MQNMYEEYGAILAKRTSEPPLQPIVPSQHVIKQLHRLHILHHHKGVGW